MKDVLKIARILLLLPLMLCLTACGGSGDSDDASVSPGGSSKDYSLTKFDGWWYRPADYVSEGISIVDIFKVEAAAGTWTVYNSYGVAGETLNCSANGDELVLEMDVFGEAVFVYNGEALLNEEGGVEFVRGEPLSSFDTTGFAGKWYKSGDKNSEYYLIEGDSYKKYSYYSPDEPLEKGTWKINDVTKIRQNGSSTIEKQIEFETPDNAFGGGDYVPTEDGNAFFDDFDAVYYVRESVLGTSVGDNVNAKFDLICHEWEGAELGDPYLKFNYDGTLEITEFNAAGTGERKTAGTWRMDGKTITLNFNDGATETVQYTDQKITVQYYNRTFEKDAG